MKNIIAISLMIFALLACQNSNNSSQQEEIPVSEAGMDMQDQNYYGDKISGEGAIAVEDMVKQVEEKGTFEGTVEGEITATCVKKGCWMTLKNMDDEIRVKFKDYGFFVPTEGQEGKTAIMQGIAYLDTISVELRKHYAEDAGKSQEEIDAITEPEYDVSFLANGVIIK